MNLELLQKELTSLSGYVQSLEQEKKRLEEYDHLLANRRVEIEQRERKLLENKKLVASEKEFIGKQQQDIAKKQLVYEKLEEKRAELAGEQSEMDSKISTNKEILLKLEERLKSIDYLKDKEKSLEQRENQLYKEMLADRQRKVELAHQEQYLESEKKRLQDIAGKYQ